MMSYTRLTRRFRNSQMQQDVELMTTVSNGVFRLAELEDKIEQGTLIELPCKVGDTVYKICPKCNSEHNGSCKNCAWRGCISYDGCSVFGLWGDGQYPPESCTIVPYTMDYRFIPVVLKHIGTKIFLTREEAEKRLKELQNG